MQMLNLFNCSLLRFFVNLNYIVRNRSTNRGSVGRAAFPRLKVAGPNPSAVRRFGYQTSASRELHKCRSFQM